MDSHLIHRYIFVGMCICMYVLHHDREVRISHKKQALESSDMDHDDEKIQVAPCVFISVDSHH